MKKAVILKTAAALAAAVVFCCAGVLAANKFGAPASIVHVVTIQWKPESTPAQRQAALDGVKTMAAEIPGIKNIWLKSTKVQPSSYNAAFVIEFEDKAAADRYVDHPAHRAWEKLYLPIRLESTSHQITN
jgi:ABC-type glycerol-3-phosphate transport system substrate-binding protein